MSDPRNVFADNQVVGIKSLYNCGNTTATCHQQGTPEAQRNYSCACPAGGTPHGSASGNVSSCATIVNNTYHFPVSTVGHSSRRAVCPAASRVEAGSMYVNAVPTTPTLIALAKQALGMDAPARL